MKDKTLNEILNFMLWFVLAIWVAYAAFMLTLLAYSIYTKLSV